MPTYKVKTSSSNKKTGPALAVVKFSSLPLVKQ
jgi:hypothetical protein